MRPWLSKCLACLAVFSLAACAAETTKKRNPVPNNQSPGGGDDNEFEEEEEGEQQEEEQQQEVVPNIETIPWVDVGLGVASKDTQSAKGTNALVVYAGYGADLAAAKAWTSELYKADLRDRGVRYIYAVQGPSNATYSAEEIKNTLLNTQLVNQVTTTTKFVMVVAHAEGSFVANEALRQLEGSWDPNEKTRGKIVYFNLDGSDNTSRYFNATVGSFLKKAYFVSARDESKATDSSNASVMQSLATTYSSLGGLVRVDATAAGCDSGAKGCVHNALVISKPHSTSGESADDYRNFTDRAVTTSYITSKAADAALNP